MINHLMRLGMAGALCIAATPGIAQSFTGAPIGDAALGRIAGREDVSAIAQAEQAASAAGNRVGNGVTTGAIQLSDKAFQNLSGLAVVNTNTGNNVAINAAMNVVVTLNPR